MRNIKTLEFFNYKIDNIVEFSTSEIHYIIAALSFENKEGITTDVPHIVKRDGIHKTIKEKFSSDEDVMIPNLFSYWRNNNSREVIEQKRIDLINKLNDRIEFVEKALVAFSCGHIKSVLDKVGFYSLLNKDSITYNRELARYINSINKRMYVTHEYVTDYEYFLIRTLESNGGHTGATYDEDALVEHLLITIYEMLDNLYGLKAVMGDYFDILLCVYPLRSPTFFLKAGLDAEKSYSIYVLDSKRMCFLNRCEAIYNQLADTYYTYNRIFTTDKSTYRLRQPRFHRKYVLDAIHMTLRELDIVYGTNDLLTYYTEDVSKYSYFLHFVKSLESFYLINIDAFYIHSSNNIYMHSLPIFVLEEVNLCLYDPIHLSLDMLDIYLEMELLKFNLSTNCMKYSSFDINSPLVCTYRKKIASFYNKKKYRVRK